MKTALTKLTATVLTTAFVATFNIGVVLADETSTGTASTTPTTAITSDASTIVATSTDTTLVTAAPTSDASSSAPVIAPNATTTTVASTSVSTPSQTSQRHGKGSKHNFRRVHVVGSKYIDTFTDGTNTFTFPGNPYIDANIGKPGASLPTHGNLTWVSTKTLEAYDTATGNLDPGTYAQESDG